jgi:hypothetical protein
MEILRALTRPILALITGGVFSYMAITGKLPVEATLAIIGMVFAFYFQSRMSEKLIDKILKHFEEKH